jgi:hypothetical protein
MRKFGKSAYKIVHYLHYLHFGWQNGGHSAQSANSARIFYTIKNISQ